MVDRRKSLHHDIIANTGEQFSAMLTTEVPHSGEIEHRMTLCGMRQSQPVAWKSAVAQAYSSSFGAELMLSVWPGDIRHPRDN